MIVRVAWFCAAALGAVLLAAAPAYADYDGETYPSRAACDSAARSVEAETADTTADTATCQTVPGSGGQEWQITITPRPWLNNPGHSNSDPNDFLGGFLQGLTSGSSSGR